MKESCLCRSIPHQKSTTPVQTLKNCVRLLRRRSQHLPFALADAKAKAGYESFFVLSSTYNRTWLIVPLSPHFGAVSYTHSTDFLIRYRFFIPMLAYRCYIIS